MYQIKVLSCTRFSEEIKKVLATRLHASHITQHTTHNTHHQTKHTTPTEKTPAPQTYQETHTERRENQYYYKIRIRLYCAGILKNN